MVIMIVAVFVLVLYVREKIHSYSLKALFLKTAVSFLFVAVGVSGCYIALNGGHSHPLACFVVFALVFGLLGDIWLDLKYIYPEHDAAYTYAGFAVFGIGHLLYMTGILLEFGYENILYVIIPYILGTLRSILVILLGGMMKLDYGKMKVPVMIYSFFLLSMVFLSGSYALMYSWNNSVLNMFFAGAVMFSVSDIILSGTYFGKNRARPVDIILNYTFYYTGQFLIASSLMFLK